MAYVMALGQFGRSFATRGRGEELRRSVLSELSSGDVVVDFDRVTNVSYSFADEFIGKLSAESDLHIQPLNMIPSVERVVTGAISRRQAVPCG